MTHALQSTKNPAHSCLHPVAVQPSVRPAVPVVENTPPSQPHSQALM